MIDKQIALLKDQIKKLDADDFDLEAWKSSTIVLLEKFFGEDNLKAKHIESIKYDYSSWSLRDASGSVTQMESCKRRGKEILLVCISELENFGIPDEVIKERDIANVIIHVLEELLTVTQYKEIRKIAQSDERFEDKKKALSETLKNYSAEMESDLLIKILTNKEIAKVI
ncbi:hypothetical protein QQ008_16625 [Fulvivirgaceae bacterium BMA10]|uniref:Uncharacterized protein n=1 Tax=Splendidivirga corallicola TaxID=3051826 RepID=A0ABT8KQJ0_9BACT|nr:hypothetical protein [Fulvivirgaceae bacterium BMA10]